MHRRAARQRLDRNGRQRLEERRQDEEIGRRAVSCHERIVHQPGKCDVPLDARRSRAAACSSSRSAPVPQITSRVSGCVRMTSFIASIRYRWPASGCSRLTLTSRCRFVMPSDARAVCLRVRRRAS